MLYLLEFRDQDRVFVPLHFSHLNNKRNAKINIGSQFKMCKGNGQLMLKTRIIGRKQKIDRKKMCEKGGWVISLEPKFCIFRSYENVRTYLHFGKLKKYGKLSSVYVFSFTEIMWTKRLQTGILKQHISMNWNWRVFRVDGSWESTLDICFDFRFIFCKVVVCTHTFLVIGKTSHNKHRHQLTKIQNKWEITKVFLTHAPLRYIWYRVFCITLGANYLLGALIFCLPK